MKNTEYDGYLGPRLSRDLQLKRLQRVIDQELTELQRRTVEGYYLEKKSMSELAQERGVRLYLPPLALCGDNAAMIGSAAYYRYRRGEVADLTLNAAPGLRLL